MNDSATKSSVEANTHVLLCADSGNADMPMMWIFPYFFEPRILECLPSFTMLDYQVHWQYITFNCYQYRLSRHILIKVALEISGISIYISSTFSSF